MEQRQRPDVFVWSSPYSASGIIQVDGRVRTSENLHIQFGEARMRFTIPETEAGPPHDVLQTLVGRMVKAGWIKEMVESSEGVVIHYTDKGTLLMKPLAERSRPFSDYLKDKSKRKPSILARLVFVFRIWKIRQELAPPALTEAEFYKLIALAIRTAPTDGPG